MKIAIDESIVETLFLELRGSSVLKEEIANYDRSRKGTPDRTYEFLVNTARRYLDRQRHLRNRKAMANASGGAASTMAPAAWAKRRKKAQTRLGRPSAPASWKRWR